MEAVTARMPAPLPVWAGRNKPRSWVLVGLALSLALHAFLCFVFYRTGFQPTTPLGMEKRQPPTFKVKKVDLEPKPLEQATAPDMAPAAKPNPDNTDVQLPDDKKSFDKLLQEVRATAAMPDDTKDVLPDKPQIEQTNLNSVINEIERTTAQSLEKTTDANRAQLSLTNVPDSGRPQPAMTGTELATSTTIKRPNTFNGIPGDSAGPRTNRAPGFSDLDALLSQKGPLGRGTAIRMPNDQLFAFGSADLQASEDLQKLVRLLQRNPNATFTIKGYTDSIGTEEYNLDLSQRRADSVKQYLISVLGMDEGNIRAIGYGKRDFVIQPSSAGFGTPQDLDAEIARQQANRRVVITVDANEE